MLKKLRENFKNKMTEQKALVTNAVSEGRAMTEEEQTKYDELEVEIKGLEKTIQNQEALEKRQAEIDKKEEEEKNPVNKPLYVNPKSENEDKFFDSFGEQLMAIVKSSEPGASIDDRLIKIQNAASGNSEGVASDGGFLVQKDFASEIVKSVFETGILAPKCKKIPVSRNSNGIKINGIDESNRGNGYRWGGVQGYWANEAATVTASKPEFRQIELNLNKLMGIGYVTDELLQDSAAMNMIMKEAFTEELKFKLDDGIVNGTGAGQPLGILKAGCLVSVAKESGQEANTVLAENIMKMYSRMPARSRAKAEWYINQEIEPQLFSMAVSVGTGGVPVYMPANGLSDKPYGTLFGRPVIPVEQCSALGTKGDIIFGDLSQYLVADKANPKSDVSMHVRFLYDEMCFRVTYRVDGQPILSKAITPYKGSSTLSPFVTLATRS